MNGFVYLPCPHCGAVNRTRVEKLDGHPVCAKCKTGLDVEKPIAVNAAQFEQVVLASELPVLVDFWATWCGPCRSMHPVLEEFARKNAGRVIVAKLDTDQNPAVSARYQIKGVPTLILFANGREFSRQVGAVPGQLLENMIQQVRV